MEHHKHFEATDIFDVNVFHLVGGSWRCTQYLPQNTRSYPRAVSTRWNIYVLCNDRRTSSYLSDLSWCLSDTIIYLSIVYFSLSLSSRSIFQFFALTNFLFHSFFQLYHCLSQCNIIFNNLYLYAWKYIFSLDIFAVHFFLIHICKYFSSLIRYECYHFYTLYKWYEDLHFIRSVLWIHMKACLRPFICCLIIHLNASASNSYAKQMKRKAY